MYSTRFLDWAKLIHSVGVEGGGKMKLGGTITNITYTKQEIVEDKIFFIAKIFTDNGELYTVKGPINRPAEIGDYVIGNFLKETAVKYGEQLKSTGKIEIHLPRDAAAIVKRCSFIATKNNTSLTPSIKAIIKHVADQNSENFWNMIHGHSPLGLAGPSKLKWTTLCEHIKEYVSTKGVDYNSSLDVENYIRGLGLKWSEKTIRSIIGTDEDCEEPGREQLVLSQILSDPLCLISVNQITEKQIGEYLEALEKLGIIDKETIAVGLLIKQIRKAEKDGNSCITVNEDRVSPLRTHSVFAKYLREYKDYIYRAPTFNDESTVAQFIVDCATSEPLDYLENADMMSLIQTLPPDDGKIPTVKQYAVVCQMFNRRLSTVQGCAGSGKTTSLRALARFIKTHKPEIRSNILFLGPTGKAVQRIRDSIADIELSSSDYIMTMHRFAGLVSKMHDKTRFADEGTPVDDCITSPFIIVLEEASMISLTTLALTIRAIHTYNYIPHIVFMGDLFQLRPVGIGMPYKDIVDSGIVASVRLDVVHRQGAGSLLLEAITQIRKREDVSVRDESFNMFKITTENGQRKILKWVEKYKDSNIAIIAPTKDLMKELTPLVRDHINPESPKTILKIDSEVLSFRKGDKIMQIKNNYARTVFNGTVGEIIGLAKVADGVRDPIEDNEVKSERGVSYEIHVRFDGRDNDFFYTFSEASEELAMAYVMTAHKAQGSEYDNTLIIMDRYIPGFIHRNLIYTAASRGKKTVMVMIKEIEILSLWKHVPADPKTNLLDQILSGVDTEDSLR